MAREPEMVVRLAAAGEASDQVVTVVGDQVITATPADVGKVVTVAADGSLVVEEGGVGGASDHGDLTGLGDDDHPYLLDSAVSAFALTLLDDANAAAARTTLGAAAASAVGVHVAYGDAGGDETTTSTSFATLPGISAITVAAAAGDILEIELVANWYVGAAGNGLVRMNVGGVIGREHLLDLPSTRPSDHIVKEFLTVTAPMISGGNVVVTPEWARGSTAVSFNMENDTTRTTPVLAVTNRGAPLV